MKHVKRLLTMVFLFLGIAVLAQKPSITGKIADPNGGPLNGVTITNKTSGAATATAADGSFKIDAAPGDVLEITMVGFGTQTVRVAKQLLLNLTLSPSVTDLNEVVLVGTRRAGRVKTETPVPVDVVNIGQVSLPTGRNDITAILNYAAPSFNYNKQSGSDGADHIDLATLRGLGPDQTLVLVNGKRRHQTAFVAVFGTRGRGNSGTDLSALPMGAIEKVEILRDGASAQYGSDAIAGVINIVLKKNTGVFSGNVGYSGYRDKDYNPFFKKDYEQYVHEKGVDGQAFNFNGNYGVKLGKNGGFLNATLNFLTQAKTYRQALDTNANSDKFMYTNIYRRAHGDGSVTTAGTMLNMELPLSGGKTFYAFGGYNYKFSDAYAFTRNFSARPERFVTDNSFNLIDIAGLTRRSKDGETYYNPHIQTRIQDGSLAAGIRGKSAGGWNWDFSNSTGYNNFHFYGDKTYNASLNALKTNFDDGGFSFLQNTVNANFSKEVSSALNIAAGAEYRYERYSLFAGEEASYKNYQPDKYYTNGSGDDVYVAGGSQGFPGYQPGDEVKANRSVFGGYFDAELDVTKNWLVSGAVRLENYSDFGFTHNYKIATRIKLHKTFNLRGSFSTGFRAPSLQQINFSSTFTTVQGGNIGEVKIAPNNSPITKAAGIPELKQEKSLNASVGFAWRPIPQLSVTVDGYWVNVKDRVVLSGQFSADDNTLNPQLIAAMQALRVSLAQFFANAVNTTNQGLDVVVDYNTKVGSKSNFRALFTGNFQKMRIDKINVPTRLRPTQQLQKTFLSDREQAFILASAPRTKYALSLEYTCKKITLGTRITRFGAVTLLGYGEDGLGIDPQVPADFQPIYVPDRYVYGAKFVGDVYAGYKINKKLSLFAGIDNIGNVHPDLGINPAARGWAFNNETGGPWDAVQMGGNGMRFFTRLGFNF
ncbi:MAG: TonB-dependent receptor [Sphingobacteriales bacterium]|nr:MAG: TonB-dependent receptor [Sphingobacteriales bacterium]